MKRPIVEAKVLVAATGGVSAASVVTSFAVYLTDLFCYPGKDAVPPEVVSFEGLVIGYLLVALAGYLAPHTYRPDLEPGSVAMTPQRATQPLQQAPQQDQTA